MMLASAAIGRLHPEDDLPALPASMDAMVKVGGAVVVLFTIAFVYVWLRSGKRGRR